MDRIKQRLRRILSRSIEEIETRAYCALVTGVASKFFDIVRLPVHDERGAFIRIVTDVDKISEQELEKIRKFPTVLYKELWLFQRSRHIGTLRYFKKELVWRTWINLSDFIKKSEEKVKKAKKNSQESIISTSP
jgi:hypothetical protein